MRATPRTVKRVALALLTGALALIIWKWIDWRAQARAGSAYAARIVCSCRYVQGRPLDSCRQDVAIDAGAVSLTDQPEEKRVTGSVPLMASASARWKPGYGCLMESY